MARKATDIHKSPVKPKQPISHTIQDKKGEDYALFEEWLSFCRLDGLEEKTIGGYRLNVNWFLWWWNNKGSAKQKGAHPRNVSIKDAREYAAYLREPAENRWDVPSSKSVLSYATVANYSRPLKI